jgi:JmjC domain, hydroxylase
MAPADRMHLMVWKADQPAIWDIFHPSDSDKLHQFLQSKGSHIDGEDPIHSLSYFLDDKELDTLSETLGVRATRIEQAAGDAIFFPTGSAFQVCLPDIWLPVRTKCHVVGLEQL